MKKTISRVLFLPKWYPYEGDPFDGNFIQNHAEAIKTKVQIDVLFVHSERKSKNEYRTEEKRYKGINELRVYFKKSNSPLFFLNPIINFYRYFNSQRLGFQQLYPDNQKPDLSHIHVLARSSPFAIYLKFFKNVPYVITEHWSGYLKESRAYKGFLKKLSHQIAVKHASAVHTVSNNLAKAMQCHRLINNYTTIYNVVDENLFRPIVTTRDDTIKAIYVGNLLQQPKRVLDSIKSVKNIINKGYRLSLDIYGEGLDEEKCRKLIENLKLENSVSIHGPINRKEVAEVMAKADFLFLNSEYENQPCVINESLCCGTPVVAPNIEGIMEVMEDFCGIIFPRLDNASFESAVIEMIENINKYDSERIRTYAVNKFGEKAIGTAFFNWYNTVINH